MSEFQGIPLSSPPPEISALEPMTSPKLILPSASATGAGPR